MEERNGGETTARELIMPGFRFHPTDEELVGFYLKRKVQKQAICVEIIKQLDIYKHDPWDLPKLATTLGEKEWYFYCPRDRKYRNSARPNRVTGGGFWKATGTDRPIYSSSHRLDDDAGIGSSTKRGGNIIGLKKSLVFYRGRAGKGVKTDWMMHEFRLPSPSDLAAASLPSKKSLPTHESWAICRIFKKPKSTTEKALSHSLCLSPSTATQPPSCPCPKGMLMCFSNGTHSSASPSAPSDGTSDLAFDIPSSVFGDRAFSFVNLQPEPAQRIGANGGEMAAQKNVEDRRASSSSSLLMERCFTSAWSNFFSRYRVVPPTLSARILTLGDQKLASYLILKTTGKRHRQGSRRPRRAAEGVFKKGIQIDLPRKSPFFDGENLSFLGAMVGDLTKPLKRPLLTCRQSDERSATYDVPRSPISKFEPSNSCYYQEFKAKITLKAPNSLWFYKSQLLEATFSLAF
ncbi:uncharacterized protein J3R85_007234 [Psidium guajava]|nr:uncharacterized protein J3R85_007234 [Psidium guajava]